MLEEWFHSYETIFQAAFEGYVLLIDVAMTENGHCEISYLMKNLNLLRDLA